MRLNKYIALATGMSRRSADLAIKSNRVEVDSEKATLGLDVGDGSKVNLDGKLLKLKNRRTTLILNKPEGYVTSRTGQGSKTIYNLLPKKFHDLKPIGRLDKNSSGLILLTNDGDLANKLTHPRYEKEKVYRVNLNKTLALSDSKKLLTGVKLSDGMSKFIKVKDCSNNTYEVILGEGRNRQIRRTFNALGYKMNKLHRIQLGNIILNKDLEEGDFHLLS